MSGPSEFEHGRLLKTDAKIDDTIKSPRKDLYGVTKNEVNKE